MAYEGGYVEYDYDDEYGIDAPQGPCEFCDQLFPIHMLIEHETGCDPDITSYGIEPVQAPPPIIETRNVNEKKNSGFLPQIIAATVTAPEIEKLKEELVEKNAIDVKKVTDKLQTQSARCYMLNEAAKELRTEEARSNVIIDIKDKHFQRQKTEEFEVKGETLMSFGTAEDPNKDFEKNAHQEYAEDVEDIEDINNLSDDDCPESLEEFWKRANDALKRRRVKNI